MHIAMYPDIHTLSQQAAQYVVRIASASLAARGRFTIALSGGTTPRELYGLLGSEPYRSQIDWQSVHIFWGDERCVSPDSPDSNYHTAQEVLLSKIPIPALQIHRMPADQPDRDQDHDDVRGHCEPQFTRIGPCCCVLTHPSSSPTSCQEDCRRNTTYCQVSLS